MGLKSRNKTLIQKFGGHSLKKKPLGRIRRQQDNTVMDLNEKGHENGRQKELTWKYAQWQALVSALLSLWVILLES